MEKVVLTEKTAKVLEILKDNGGAMFAADIAEVDPALFTSGARSVSPILVHLTKAGKEYVANVGKAERKVLDKDGNEVTRSYAQYQVTDAGLALEYDIKTA